MKNKEKKVQKNKTVELNSKSDAINAKCDDVVACGIGIKDKQAIFSMQMKAKR